MYITVETMSLYVAIYIYLDIMYIYIYTCTFAGRVFHHAECKSNIILLPDPKNEHQEAQ